MMRLNKFIALSTGISRRSADVLIKNGQIKVNNQEPRIGQQVSANDIVTNDGVILQRTPFTTLLLNKPVGYVCSRNGQGGPTIYDLLGKKYSHLKSVGRLDKDSSGIILMTNDGQLANRLTHPSNSKVKVYEVTLDKPLEPLHHQMLVDIGVRLEDGNSQFLSLSRLEGQNKWEVRMTEGKNRQIRRTFFALGYRVIKLHRTQFGQYTLDKIPPKGFLEVDI